MIAVVITGDVVDGGCCGSAAAPTEGRKVGYCWEIGDSRDGGSSRSEITIAG
jgi:hypothetical protein